MKLKSARIAWILAAVLVLAACGRAAPMSLPSDRSIRWPIPPISTKNLTAPYWYTTSRSGSTSCGSTYTVSYKGRWARIGDCAGHIVDITLLTVPRGATFEIHAAGGISRAWVPDLLPTNSRLLMVGVSGNIAYYRAASRGRVDMVARNSPLCFARGPVWHTCLALSVAVS